MIRRLLPVVLVLALSACGFHLRSALVLPDDLGPMRVASVDRYSPLADALTQSIGTAGVILAEPGDENATVLDLLSERWADTPIAVDQFGRAQEYSLRYAVVFEVRQAGGRKPVPRQAVELSRDYISNPVNSIGTEGEREILVRELRREMVASIIRRLDAVARTAPAVSSQAEGTPEDAVVDPAPDAAPEAAPEAAPPQPE